VPAVAGTATVHRAAGATLPVDAHLSSGEQPLHLPKLGIGLLQFRALRASTSRR